MTRYRYRRALGASIEHAGLPDALVRSLRAYGIVTCAQVQALLDRRLSEAQSQHLFGIGLTEARSRIGQPVQQRLPRAVRAALAQTAFAVPSLTGIYGPISSSTQLMACRAPRRAAEDRGRPARPPRPSHPDAAHGLDDASW